MSENKSDSKLHEFIGIKFSQREFWIDILGGLVPGALVVLSAWILSINIYAFWSYSQSLLATLNKSGNASTNTIQFAQIIPDISSATVISFFAVMGFLSYVIGHLFYRQDPKIPNYQSFSHLRDKMLTETDPRYNQYLRKLLLNFILQHKNNANHRDDRLYLFPLDFQKIEFEKILAVSSCTESLSNTEDKDLENWILNSFIHPLTSPINKDNRKAYKQLSSFFTQILKKAIDIETRSPNEPKRIITKDKSDLSLQTTLRENYACANEYECQFPFSYYEKYLEHRGFTHLKKLVSTTRSEEPDSKPSRSKNYINTLKIRLKAYCPEQCGVLIRNEAHVRLASSTWHVSSFLQTAISRVFALIFALLFSYFIISYIYTVSTDESLKRISSNELFFDYLNPLVPTAFFILPTLLLYLACGWGKRTITKFLHYQRLREVFYVLETAYSVFVNDRKNVFADPFGIKNHAEAPSWFDLKMSIFEGDSKKSE